MVDTSATETKKITRANLVTDLAGAITLDGLSDVSSITEARGQIIRRGASTWDALDLGSSGKILQSDGTDIGYSTATFPTGSPTDSNLLVGDGTNYVLESGATLRTSLGLGTSDNPTFASVKIQELFISPDTSQSITAVSDTIASANGVLRISSNADYVMTSTPTITAGSDGEVMVLINTGSFEIELQDDGILANSDVFLGGASGVLKPNEVLVLIFNTSISGWNIYSHPNNVGGGGNATVINVRNTSGSTIAKGVPVYASGWNAGQIRTTIAKADGDDSAKMPSIGLTATSIANNKNGQVIASGVLSGFDTSSFSNGDSLFVSTTAGALTATRPIVDDVQKIGIVLRSHASKGVVLISGAGRVNDTQWNISVSTLRTGVTAGNTLLLQARDVDGTSWSTFATLTANDTPTFDLAAATTIGTNAIAYTGGAFHDGFSDFVGNEHIDWTSASDDFSTSGTLASGIQTITGSPAILIVTDGGGIAMDTSDA